MTLSYIIVTYNKLPYLKTVIADLLAHKKEDEEIIVVDGGSSDGTPAYLEERLRCGDIERYVSERDLGQSHAINKGMLMARGTLFKILNDDDTYYFDKIEVCKEFMLKHPEIDALGTNGISHDGKEYHREEDFLMWKTLSYHPFQIAEQGLLLRRDSIPVFGLADTASRFWEGDFTLRLTSGKARLAWYTGITWKHVFNQDSVSVNAGNGWVLESAALRRRHPGLYSKWKHLVPKPIRDLIRFFIPKKRLVAAEKVTEPTFLF
ncbi:MAG: glycosyltransferase [Candidatus Parcubacteria bacterium]|nr:glycosyltransferase [Candidatus Parcubacteria bacterium]